MENPDLVLQETGSRLTYSRLNYVPSGDTLRRDAISSIFVVFNVFLIRTVMFCYISLFFSPMVSGWAGGKKFVRAVSQKP